ncbi:hypothetical protein BDQ17DRAFT_414314 [Cyathus striatus]|nr:hypothetical protein BDQ17DRAFT_414314 [Cyathus striatus]
MSSGKTELTLSNRSAKCKPSFPVSPPPPQPPPLPQSTDFPPLSATNPPPDSSAPQIPSSDNSREQTNVDDNSDSLSFDSDESLLPSEGLSSVIDELVDDLKMLVQDAVNDGLDPSDPRKVKPLSSDARHERLLLCVWASVLCLRHREGGIADLEDVWHHLTLQYPGVYEPDEPEAGADDPSSILDYQYRASDIPSTCPLVG